jgi:hypothetical protein
MEELQNNELSKKIMLYFDRLMNEDDEREFLKQLNENPAGHKIFAKEKMIREKIKANIHRPSHTKALGLQIREQIKKYPGQ